MQPYNISFIIYTGKRKHLPFQIIIYSNNVKKSNWAIIYGTLNNIKRSLIPENMPINNVYCSNNQTIDDELNELFTSSL